MNANKLRGRLAEQRLTQEQLAAAIGINRATLHRKMDGASDFSREEMLAIREVLGLSDDDFMAIFFSS